MCILFIGIGMFPNSAAASLEQTVILRQRCFRLLYLQGCLPCWVRAFYCEIRNDYPFAERARPISPLQTQSLPFIWPCFLFLCRISKRKWYRDPVRQTWGLNSRLCPPTFLLAFVAWWKGPCACRVLNWAWLVFLRLWQEDTSVLCSGTGRDNGFIIINNNNSHDPITLELLHQKAASKNVASVWP